MVDLQAAQQRYSAVAVLLHWVIALALGFQLALGFAMPKGRVADFDLFQLHKSIGITIFLLSLLRLGWRLTHRPPPAVEGGFNGFLAKAVHVLLYVFMIGAPLTGWAIVSTSPINVPTMFWGVIPWPHLPLSGGLHETVEEAHELLAWTALALIALHVAGALRHQLLVKDGLLRRMAPGGSALAGFALLALAVATFFATGMYVAGTYLVPALERQSAAEAQGRIPLAASPIPAAQATEAAEAEEAAADEPGPPPVWTISPAGASASSSPAARIRTAAPSPTGAVPSASIPRTPKAQTSASTSGSPALRSATRRWTRCCRGSISSTLRPVRPPPGARPRCAGPGRIATAPAARYRSGASAARSRSASRCRDRACAATSRAAPPSTAPPSASEQAIRPKAWPVRWRLPSPSMRPAARPEGAELGVSPGL